MNATIAIGNQVLGDTYLGHMGGGAWILMGIGMVLFWALVVVGIVWLVRTLTGPRDPAESRFATAESRFATPGPRDVLDRRLAEGAITAEEYGERRQLLKD